MATQTEETPDMVKLKELATEYGPGLGRVIEVTNKHAKAILAAQDAGGPKCWEPETDEETAPESEATNQAV